MTRDEEGVDCVPMIFILTDATYRVGTVYSLEPLCT